MARTDQKRKLDSSLLINGESAKKSRLNGKTDLLKMMMDDDCRTNTKKDDNKKPKSKKGSDLKNKIKKAGNKNRQRPSIIRYPPTLTLRKGSLNAIIKKNKDSRTPVYLSSFQETISLGLQDLRSPFRYSSLCEIRRGSNIQNIVCVVLDGLGVDHLEVEHSTKPTESNQEKFIEKLNMVEVVSPARYGGNVVQEIALIHGMTEEENELKETKRIEESKEKEYKRKEREVKENLKKVGLRMDKQTLQSLGPKKGSKLDLLLNIDQLKNAGYPLPIEGYSKNHQHFVHTKDEYTEVTENSPLFGLDCEMCETKNGSQLTYVTLVTEDLEVLYKSYVLTNNTITNYLTKYSGVRRADLRSLTTTLPEIQEAFRKLLPSNCILVGHSLNGDLNALEMMHPYIIDTSICYNLTGTLQTGKLKLFTKVFLDRDIQSNTGDGHCPEEDSLASLELALLKIQKGNAFGDLRYHQEEGFDEIIRVRNEWLQDNNRRIPYTVNSTIRAKKSKHTSVVKTSKEKNSCEDAETVETNHTTEAEAEAEAETEAEAEAEPEANDKVYPPRILGLLSGKDVPAETLTSYLNKTEKGVEVYVTENLKELYKKIPSFIFETKKFEIGINCHSVVAKFRKSYQPDEKGLFVCHLDTNSLQGKRVSTKKKLAFANSTCETIFSLLPACSLLIVICPGDDKMNGAAAFKLKE